MELKSGYVLKPALSRVPVELRQLQGRLDKFIIRKNASIVSQFELKDQQEYKLTYLMDSLDEGEILRVDDFLENELSECLKELKEFGMLGRFSEMGTMNNETKMRTLTYEVAFYPKQDPVAFSKAVERYTKNDTSDINSKTTEYGVAKASNEEKGMDTHPLTKRMLKMTLRLFVAFVLALLVWNAIKLGSLYENVNEGKMALGEYQEVALAKMRQSLLWRLPVKIDQWLGNNNFILRRVLDTHVALFILYRDCGGRVYVHFFKDFWWKVWLSMKPVTPTMQIREMHRRIELSINTTISTMKKMMKIAMEEYYKSRKGETREEGEGKTEEKRLETTTEKERKEKEKEEKGESEKENKKRRWDTSTKETERLPLARKANERARSHNHQPRTRVSAETEEEASKDQEVMV